MWYFFEYTIIQTKTHKGVKKRQGSAIIFYKIPEYRIIAKTDSFGSGNKTYGFLCSLKQFMAIETHLSFITPTKIYFDQNNSFSHPLPRHPILCNWRGAAIIPMIFSLFFCYIFCFVYHFHIALEQFWFIKHRRE